MSIEGEGGMEAMTILTQEEVERRLALDELRAALAAWREGEGGCSR